MKRDKAQLVELAVSLMEQVHMAMRLGVPQEWLELELSMAQFKILLFLFTQGPARVGAIASELEVTMATATGILDGLVRRGLIVRSEDPRDRRGVVCQLSPPGQQLMERLLTLGRETLRGILHRLDVPQLELVAQGMEAILEAALAEKAALPLTAGASSAPRHREREKG